MYIYDVPYRDANLRQQTVRVQADSAEGARQQAAKERADYCVPGFGYPRRVRLVKETK